VTLTVQVRGKSRQAVAGRRDRQRQEARKRRRCELDRESVCATEFDDPVAAAHSRGATGWKTRHLSEPQLTTYVQVWAQVRVGSFAGTAGNGPSAPSYYLVPPVGMDASKRKRAGACSAGRGSCSWRSGRRWQVCYTISVGPFVGWIG
jgi:hypothetical protein